MIASIPGLPILISRGNLRFHPSLGGVKLVHIHPPSLPLSDGNNYIINSIISIPVLSDYIPGYAYLSRSYTIAVTKKYRAEDYCSCFRH